MKTHGTFSHGIIGRGIVGIATFLMIGCAKSGSASSDATPTDARTATLASEPGSRITFVDNGVTTDCGTERGWNYCVHRYSGGNPDVLYYIHGYTDSRFGWLVGMGDEDHGDVSRLQEKLGANSPTVVLISYAGSPLDSWLLYSGDTRVNEPKVATLKHFTSVAMPFIEKNHRVMGSGGKRILYGMSMGGFNAAQLCMRRPDLWSRCLLQQALLSTQDPFTDPMDYTFLAGYMIRANFEPSEWRASNPVNMINSIDVRLLPPILVTGAVNDEMGFFNDDHQFATKMKQRGANVQWRQYPGDHSSFDPNVVYEFVRHH